MTEIVIGIVLVLALIIIILINSNNKFNFAIIKIDEAENNLDVLLLRKLGLIERSRNIVMKELKMDEFLDNILELENQGLNHFQLNDALKTEYKELYKVLDDNEKLFKSESLTSVLQELSDNEEAIIGSIKFYNDNVSIFNQLVASFPAKFIALFHHYRRKEFYTDENKEMYEILND